MYLCVCKVCGESFTNKRKSSICSKKCKVLWLSKYCKQYYKEKIKEEPKEKFCKWCGTKLKDDIKRIYPTFCTAHCHYLYLSNLRETELYKEKYQEELSKYIDIDLKSKELYKKFGHKTINTWLTPGFSQMLKEHILARDNYECYVCGKKEHLHVHHIIPRIQGGPHIPENLITLCAGCHRSIESGNEVLAIKSCVRRAIENVVLKDAN